MDPKTRQLVEEAERLTNTTEVDYDDEPGRWSTRGIRDATFEHEVDCNLFAASRRVIAELCSAVREQDKRARHAEAERDTFDKRIDELEAQRHAIIQACLGRDVKDALASQVFGLWKSQSKLTEYAAELEAQLREAVELAAEAVPYVSDYFRDKYEMNDRLAKLTSDSPSPRQTLESR